MSSGFDPHPILMTLFLRLRRGSSRLGVGELLAAVGAVEGGWGSGSPDELEEVLRLLWCHSRAEASEFASVWEDAVADPASGISPADRSRPLTPRPPQEEPPTHDDGTPGSGSSSGTATDRPASPPGDWTALPVLAPESRSPGDEATGLYADWPISRRFMAYAWRQLRRPALDGPEDVLDVQATVARASRLGFFLAPVYRRREHNHAHLVLLLDQDGSMVPFHRFGRDLVETARYESTLQQVDVLYFHNVPAESVWSDPHLTDLMPWDRVAAQCSGDSGVLIVSDAGAARGHRRLDRIRATTGFLSQVRRQTALVAWLNPMPGNRWPGTSAQIIAGLVPMFPMDPDGLVQAIDVLRGLRTHE
jgi:hypothetical protein